MCPAMRPCIYLMGLLSVGMLASCASKKEAGSRGALADNGGYSDGGFYGDSSDPAPQGYPQDGESFATHGGVPFGHSDRAESPAPVEPTMASVAPVAARPAPAPQPVAFSRVVVTQPASADPYREAYSDGSGYGGDHGAEAAVVTPYVERIERVEPVATASTSKPKTASGSSAARASTSKKAVVSPSKKQTPVVASSTPTGKTGASKASGKQSGTTVKAVYKPPGKSAAKKKATVVRVHDVKRGDTLSKLSGRYGVTVAHLKKRNKLTGDTIVVGKRLTVD
jgi:LysM repeat protein